MKWIKHDTDANQDAKLQNVLLDYGLEGYGLYWYCIELIAGKVDKDNITFELEHDARIIARNVGSTAQKIEEMMRYFVKLGLFENSQGVITCMKLARRLDKSMTSNPEMRAIIESLKSHDSVMTESENVMQDKIRLDQSIKNTVDSDESTKPDFVATEFDRFWRNYPTKKAKTSAEKSFRKFVRGKHENQVRFWVDLILNYHHDCIERGEFGAAALHAATLINQQRWKDAPEFVEKFKENWKKENAGD